MRLDTSQHLRLEQSMKLAPRIIAAMEILQLPIMALQERIEAEMESNPVLEQHDPGVDDQAPPQRDDEPIVRGDQPMVVGEPGSQNEDYRRLAEFQDEYGSDFFTDSAPPRAHRDSGDRDKKMDAMANAPANDQSLADYLLGQFVFVEAHEQVTAAGKIIINAIDDDGYLRTDIEELSASSGPPVPLQRFRDALKLVQALEPPGVGARDLKECLILQLEAEAEAGHDVALEIQLVQSFLRDIEMNRLPQIARRTEKTVDQIKAAIANISRLNPRPGSLIGQRSAPIITPDAIVEFDDEGNVIVSMPEGNLPGLYVSRSYRKMVASKATDRPTRAFIRQNIRSAQWLIEAIQQRRHTVKRVVEEVFKMQREFLDDGPEALHALPMADIAQKVGVHVATVSRAVAGKYVQTPRGIYPLRMFFSGGTANSGGKDIAWDAIRARLKEIIDAEDKADPLNDDDLAAEVSRRGITIARRTVAKYRGIMNIPPARKRVKY
jgi:RNA polymerase sigma-54 factor